MSNGRFPKNALPGIATPGVKGSPVAVDAEGHEMPVVGFLDVSPDHEFPPMPARRSLATGAIDVPCYAVELQGTTFGQGHPDATIYFPAVLHKNSTGSLWAHDEPAFAPFTLALNEVALPWNNRRFVLARASSSILELPLNRRGAILRIAALPQSAFLFESDIPALIEAAARNRHELEEHADERAADAPERTVWQEFVYQFTQRLRDSPCRHGAKCSKGIYRDLATGGGRTFVCPECRGRGRFYAPDPD